MPGPGPVIPYISPLMARFAVAKPGPYATQLYPEEEAAFQRWAKASGAIYDRNDYDMRGFYRAMMQDQPGQEPEVSKYDGYLHFPDSYKTPYHETFSNESVYATPDAPSWQEDKLIDKYGRVVADESVPLPPPKKGGSNGR